MLFAPVLKDTGLSENIVGDLDQCEHACVYVPMLSQQGPALIHSPHPEHHFTDSSISHKGSKKDGGRL